MLIKLNLLFIILTLTYCKITVNTETPKIQQCISKLQSKHFKDHIAIISTQYVVHSKFTVIKLANITSFPQRLGKFNNFIFQINSSKDFDLVLKQLHRTQLWNSRAKYMVGYHGHNDIGSIFEVSWLHNILNIIVIVEDNSEAKVYTYFPYKHRQVKLLGDCNSEDLPVFPEKIPLDLNGSVIRFMAYPMIPYVINLNASREKASQAGIEVTIIKVLSQRMNFTEVYIPHQHKFWGYKDLNGSYQFMFASLYRNECDVLIGMQFGNASHLVDFDAGVVHLIDASVWWVPVALPIPQWKNITAIFEPNVWFIIVIGFLINGIAWWLFGHKHETSDDYNDWVLCIMASLYTLLQGSVELPKTWRLRSIFILWLMTSLLIFTAYQSQLVSILTSPLYDHQIQSMEEVVNSTLEWGMFAGAALAFEDPTNWVHVEILRNYDVCSLSNFCVNRTAFQRDFAAIRNLRNVRYFLPRYYTGSNGKLQVYQLQDNQLGIWVQFYMRKGFPFLDRFNTLVMLMQSTGLIEKWDKDIGFFLHSVQSEPDHVPLTVNNLQSAFYILSIGLVFAVFVFCGEIACGRMKNLGNHLIFNE